MTVVAAVAGPSRLPMITLRQASRRLRPACSSRPASSAATNEPNPTDLGESAEDTGDRNEAGSGYRNWIGRAGRLYESPRKGQQATWLGGRVPFPANPSFCPPPPLSNDLQNIIYDQLRSGSTVAQLSHRHNVSKARIEAVRKLKDVEREFNRQQLPTQDAFLGGMEDLLGVRSPLNPRTKAADAVRERDEATTRALHASSNVEQIEEDRWDAGIGRGGAFGQRTTQTEREGIERTVWEFRDEETEVREKRAASTSDFSSQGLKQAVQEVAAAQAGSDTPEAQRVAVEMAHPPSTPSDRGLPEVSNKAGKYTFISVSGQSRWKRAGPKKKATKKT